MRSIRGLRGALVGGLLAFAAAPAVAAELVVQVDDTRGAPVADAVVTLLPLGGVAAPKRPGDATHRIDQKDLAFLPYLEVFRPGDAVVFRNSDRTRHHVYSFSPARTFEFVLAPGESSSPLQLDKGGVIAVGCNIHDRMISYLYVSDAPWIARSAADGRVRFPDLPAGAYDVRVWQPRLRPGKPDLVQSGVIVASQDSRTVHFSLALLPDARRQFDRETTHY